LAFIAGFIAGLLAFGFIQRPAFAQALGLGHPGQGFMACHFRLCVLVSSPFGGDE
jgi:hypothetical protein